MERILFLPMATSLFCCRVWTIKLTKLWLRALAERRFRNLTDANHLLDPHRICFVGRVRQVASTTNEGFSSDGSGAHQSSGGGKEKEARHQVQQCVEDNKWSL